MRVPYAAALPVLMLMSGPAVAQDGDALRGQAQFRRQCAACHQVAQPRNGAGPTLQNVIDRAAGDVEGFNYSPALRDSDITWTPETLDVFLTNPTGLVPGTRMTIRVTDAQRRHDIIAYLSAAD